VNVLDRLEAFRRDGVLSDAQARALSSLESNDPVSLRAETRVLMYAGVLFVAAGAAATVKAYFTAWGPWAIVGSLTVAAAACLAYVFRRADPWSPARVPAPTAGFDYALFLACLLISVDVGYIEARWGILGGDWRRHLMASAALFLALAYRYDNRLVLSLGISSLAGWLGLELNFLDDLFWGRARNYALVFGGFCAAAGVWGARVGVKEHFLDVYLNFAVHFVGGALLAGAYGVGWRSFHVYLLAGLCAAGVKYAFRTRRLLYLVYATLYGYAGLSTILGALSWFWSFGFYFPYYIASSLAVLAFLFWASRAFKEEA
jgi:hypothetical protein